MNPQNNPFVVDRLRPEGEQNEQTYQLTNASVSPTRTVGRDRLGMPIEDTIPACYYGLWVHPCGSVNKVPLRTGPVYSMEPEAFRYEQTEIQRMIHKGWLPLAECPHTTKYVYLGVRGPLVPGGEDCGGQPDGCVHMQAIMKERTAHFRTIYDEEMRKLREMSEAEAEKMAKAVAEGVGIAIAERLGDPREQIKANRNNLKKQADE